MSRAWFGPKNRAAAAFLADFSCYVPRQWDAESSFCTCSPLLHTQRVPKKAVTTKQRRAQAVSQTLFTLKIRQQIVTAHCKKSLPVSQHIETQIMQVRVLKLCYLTNNAIEAVTSPKTSTQTQKIFVLVKRCYFFFFLQTQEFDQSINLDENIFLLTSHDMTQLYHIITHVMLP